MIDGTSHRNDEGNLFHPALDLMDDDDIYIYMPPPSPLSSAGLWCKEMPQDNDNVTKMLKPLLG